jgi:hypothetical protein
MIPAFPGLVAVQQEHHVVVLMFLPRLFTNPDVLVGKAFTFQIGAKPVDEFLQVSVILPGGIFCGIPQIKTDKKNPAEPVGHVLNPVDNRLHDVLPAWLVLVCLNTVVPEFSIS